VSFWLVVLAMCSVVVFLANWLKNHAEMRIKGTKKPAPREDA
jgi:hypothetical protein